MRSIARQSARLASSSRVRQSSGARQQHIRSFSRSAQPLIDARGQPGEHESSVPADQRHDERQSTAEDGSKAVSQAEKETAEEEIKSQGAKTRRSRIHNANNQKPPKPPPIPEWFLNHNVKLRVDTASLDKKSAKPRLVIRCMDKDTGHVLFTVPYFRINDEAEIAEEAAEKEQNGQEAGTKKSLDDSFFDNKFTIKSTPSTGQQSFTVAEAETESLKRSLHVLADASATKGGSSFGKTEDEINTNSLLRWALLEAETGIRSGFTVTSEASLKSLNAASRVDIMLHCPDSDSHEQMDELVEDLAALTQADLIRLDANDFADLTADYVGQGTDVPGSFSSLGYEVFDGYTASPAGQRPLIDEEEVDEQDEDEQDEDDDIEDSRSNGSGGRKTLDDLRRAIFAHRVDFSKALEGITIAMPVAMSPDAKTHSDNRAESSPFRPAPTSSSRSLDDNRLRMLLDELLEATKIKRGSTTAYSDSMGYRLTHTSNAQDAKQGLSVQDLLYQQKSRDLRSSPKDWKIDISNVLVRRIVKGWVDNAGKLAVDVAADKSQAHGPPTPSAIPNRTVIHIRDLKDICSSRTGNVVIRELVRVVQKRRRGGQEIMIVGTTAQDVGSGLFRRREVGAEETDFRRINIPPFFHMSKQEQSQLQTEDLTKDDVTGTSYRRILEINIRHIQSMLQRLRPSDSVDLFSAKSQVQLSLAGSELLGQRVLPFDQVQRLVLTAIGLSQTHAMSDVVNAAHVGLAAFIAGRADRADQAHQRLRFQTLHQKALGLDAKTESLQSGKENQKGSAKVEKLKKGCNQHESKLLPGVMDPQNIKVGFNDVHAPPETIDALKTMTSLSLLRPDAFKYGVLAADRLPGLMLYGPPGTGKTLLAKAVAKESHATVLEVSGAQIYEKYVGEGEKMVRAVFSLAKKLSPCVVFIDEADAIFGSRSSAGNRNTHREIINQFLREWDGMDSHNVFIMVASNRPFDMDDAVLRRLPRRLLVDLPVAKDREAILKIHLKDEQLDTTVDLAKLSEETPLYSGSDLKNLCVAAALAAVRDENELVASKQEDKEFKLPERRVLSARHFEKASKEISASISEDMSSLTAIRKFDEQFGDRKGRRKKSSYGFGNTDAGVDESAARVRHTTTTQTTPPPPPPP